MRYSAAEKDLLTLLRFGLGADGNVTLSEHPDWMAIYQLAERHAVLGLLGEGINMVQKPVSVTQQLFEDSLEIARRNKHINELLAKVVSYLRVNGIECILQKGQGVARLYPNPMMRMSGDVDLLFSPQHSSAPSRC